MIHSIHSFHQFISFTAPITLEMWVQKQLENVYMYESFFIIIIIIIIIIWPFIIFIDIDSLKRRKKSRRQFFSLVLDLVEFAFFSCTWRTKRTTTTIWTWTSHNVTLFFSLAFWLIDWKIHHWDINVKKSESSVSCLDDWCWEKRRSLFHKVSKKVCKAIDDYNDDVRILVVVVLVFNVQLLNWIEM